jgi:hypothetical protein
MGSERFLVKGKGLNSDIETVPPVAPATATREAPAPSEPRPENSPAQLPRTEDATPRPTPQARTQDLAADQRQKLQQMMRDGTPAEIYEFGRKLLEVGNKVDGFEAIDVARARGNKDALLQFGRWYDPRYQDNRLEYFRPNLLLALSFYRKSMDSGSREATTELAGLCADIRTNRIDTRSMSLEARTNLAEACRL